MKSFKQHLEEAKGSYRDNIAIGRKIKDASDADDKARANQKHFIKIDDKVQTNDRNKPTPYFNKKMADAAAKALVKKNPKSKIKVMHHKDIND